MSQSKKAGFYLWRCLPDAQVIKVGALALEQLDNGRIQDIQFQYAHDYLQHPQALALDPLHCPLLSERQDFQTAGQHLPGFIDDCLPDDWGRKIVASRLGKRHVDTLTLMQNLNGAAIGAIKMIPAENKSSPPWLEGVAYSEVRRIADLVWQEDWQALSRLDQEISLLLSGGSRIGGARPKILASDEGQQYLVKFNRAQDSFDMAAAEWASLKVLEAAELKVAKAELDQLGERKCLKVKRFDISAQGGRYHLLTLNALLKDIYSQDDAHLGRYEDIAQVIRQYCENPLADLEQLLGQLLINSVLKNTDDHLRNFSLIHDGAGWHLSAAYDIVPSDTVGSYHQIQFDGKPFLPVLEQAEQAGKILGVSKGASRRIAERIRAALALWPEFLRQAEVSEADYVRLSKMVGKPLA